MTAGDALIALWRGIVRGPDKSWVLFKNGTCVFPSEPAGKSDLATQAIELMKTWGPVHAGSSAGDFSVITLKDAPGWAVTCHHKDILTYVGPEEVEATPVNEVTIGLVGRSKRDRDACDLEILHIEIA